MRLATSNILHGRSPADGQVDLGRFASAVAARHAGLHPAAHQGDDRP